MACALASAFWEVLPSPTAERSAVLAVLTAAQVAHVLVNRAMLWSVPHHRTHEMFKRKPNYSFNC